MKYAFNGRFLTKKITGQERFASELILHLDKICKKGEFCVVTSKLVQDLPKYENIEIVQTGKLKREAWEQFCLGPYLRKHNLRSVNLTTTFPLLHADVVCLHDVSVFEIGHMFMHTTYGFFGTIWKRILYYIARYSAKRVLTVSNYSKERLHNLLGFNEEKISVIYNAWQHCESIIPDEHILEKTGLVGKSYFFSLSSLSPQKNFIWIKEVAKRNPKLLFVVTGKAEGFTQLGADKLKTDNLIFTGYLSDGEIKTLMQHCRAFIHPAIYEGFGIPPLEAMACGAQVIVSTATCLPEIYGNAAHYIDPYDYDVDLEDLLLQPVSPRESVLERFCWQHEAEKLLRLLRQ